MRRSLTPVEGRLLVDWISSFQSRRLPCPSERDSSQGFCVRVGSGKGWEGWTNQGNEGRELASGASERSSVVESGECRAVKAERNNGERDLRRMRRLCMGDFCG